jgi:ABC-type phosphate/phosphonate transport system substrate-binding protein
MTPASAAASPDIPAATAAWPAVAALPMYDWPVVRGANDLVWRRLAAALRARGLNAPESLERTRPEAEIWRDPGLLIAQTCGYPLVSGLLGHVRLVATPCYGVDGCEGALYSSHIIVRRDEPARDLAAMAGWIAAINSYGSQSGLAALYESCAAAGGPQPFFGGSVLTGSHLASMRSVAAGEADVAAIDAVCWALARRDCPELTGQLKSLGTTRPTPGLPFVTAAGRTDAEVGLICAALAECLADQKTQALRRALFITGIEALDIADYCAAIKPLDGADIARLFPPGP